MGPSQSTLDALQRRLRTLLRQVRALLPHPAHYFFAQLDSVGLKHLSHYPFNDRFNPVAFCHSHSGAFGLGLIHSL